MSDEREREVVERAVWRVEDRPGFFNIEDEWFWCVETDEPERRLVALVVTDVSAQLPPPTREHPTFAVARQIVADHNAMRCRSHAPSAAQEGARPEIVCLCGSTRFIDTFQSEYGRLTDEGKIVLTVGRVVPQSEQVLGSARKVALDELHKRKIDLADRVLVLNVGGYVGPSTRSEIEYAEAHGKPVTYLEEGTTHTPPPEPRP